MSYVKCGYDRASEQLASPFESDSCTRQEIKEDSYPQCSPELLLNSYDKSSVVILTYKYIVYFDFRVAEQLQLKASKIRSKRQRVP